MSSKTTAHDYIDLRLHIDGEWRDGKGRASEEVLNPANEQVLGLLPHASKQDLDDVLDASARGFETWRHTPIQDRAQVLFKASALLDERQETFSRLMTLEQGKPLSEARGEVAFSSALLEFFAGEATRQYGTITPSRVSGGRNYLLRQPIGPSLALSPWNFPIITPMRKVGAALAAGCSCILKPSEETPGSAVAMMQLFIDAGLPPGVLQLVFGVPADVSSHLMASPIIRKISFTGSIPVGKHLGALAAQTVKATTLELGGHSPVLVFDDADLDKAISISAAAKFRNAGQVCIAPTRFYVHEKVHDAFVKGLIGFAENLNLGDGLDAATTMGPMANERRLQAMEGFVQDAQKVGASLRCGGKRVGNRGYFYAPTVLDEIPDEARIMQEEPFGPIASVQRFDDMDEMLGRANSLEFALAGYAFTESARTVSRLMEELQTGMIGINHCALTQPELPFGGIKESGIGVESGAQGVEAYTVTKLINHLVDG
ncbi:MAG: NAD-dependent succinate-semialdehyde dehydrogenase [Pseudomonadota bacterium]